MSKKTYHVHFIHPHGEAVEATVQCTAVQIDEQGTKFLNEWGSGAELVAFWPADRVLEVRLEVPHA